MEFKWLMVAFAIVMSSIALGDAVSQYSKNQCRVAYSQSGKTADEIANICN